MSVEQLLARRRDRAIAIVLNFKEKEVDHHLPPEVRAKLRKVVLDQFNDLYETMIDLSAEMPMSGETVFNDLYLEKLAAMHSDVGEIRRMLTPR